MPSHACGTNQLGQSVQWPENTEPQRGSVGKAWEGLVLGLYSNPNDALNYALHHHHVLFGATSCSWETDARLYCAGGGRGGECTLSSLPASLPALPRVACTYALSQ